MGTGARVWLGEQQWCGVSFESLVGNSQKTKGGQKGGQAVGEKEESSEEMPCLFLG